MSATKKRSKSRTPRRKSTRKKKRSVKGIYYDEHFVECSDFVPDVIIGKNVQSSSDDSGVSTSYKAGIESTDTVNNTTDIMSASSPVAEEKSVEEVSDLVKEMVDSVCNSEMFPQSVVKVDTNFVKKIGFDCKRQHQDDEDQHNWFLLDNIYCLWHLWWHNGSDFIPESVGDELCSYDPQTNHEKNDSSIELIEQYKNSLLVKEEMIQEQQKTIDCLLEVQLEKEVIAERCKSFEILLEQKITELKIMTDKAEMYKESNMHRRELVRLESIINLNEGDIKEAKEEEERLTKKILDLNDNITYFMNENTRLRNKSKVEKQEQNSVNTQTEIRQTDRDGKVTESQTQSKETQKDDISTDETDKLVSELNSTLKMIDQEVEAQQARHVDKMTALQRLLESGNSSTELQTANKFASLRWSSNNPKSTEISSDKYGMRSSLLPVPPIRPGMGTYKEALIERKNVMIVSTSITRGININEICSKYNGRVSLHRFHGGHVKHMKNYISTHLAEEQPGTVVLLGGGNDIPSGNKAWSALETANNIMEMGQMCKLYGVTRICISSVLPRRDFYVQLKRRELNGLLENLCLLNNFEFINHTNIILSKHVNWDGVHLNSNGSEMLASNLLECILSDATA